jgi:hypothetical protein
MVCRHEEDASIGLNKLTHSRVHHETTPGVCLWRVAIAYRTHQRKSRVGRVEVSLTCSSMITGKAVLASPWATTSFAERAASKCKAFCETIKRMPRRQGDKWCNCIVPFISIFFTRRVCHKTLDMNLKLCFGDTLLYFMSVPQRNLLM